MSSLAIESRRFGPSGVPLRMSGQQWCELDIAFRRQTGAGQRFAFAHGLGLCLNLPDHGLSTYLKTGLSGQVHSSPVFLAPSVIRSKCPLAQPRNLYSANLYRDRGAADVYTPHDI